MVQRHHKWGRPPQCPGPEVWGWGARRRPWHPQSQPVSKAEALRDAMERERGQGEEWWGEWKVRKGSSFPHLCICLCVSSPLSFSSFELGAMPGTKGFLIPRGPQVLPKSSGRVPSSPAASICLKHTSMCHQVRNVTTKHIQLFGEMSKPGRRGN